MESQMKDFVQFEKQIENFHNPEISWSLENEFKVQSRDKNRMVMNNLHR